MTESQAFVANAYQIAWIVGLVIAMTAVTLFMLTFRPDETRILPRLGRYHFWIFMILMFGILLTLPHWLDVGPPTVYRF